ncbi:MAG: hypothetical protein JOY61_12675, partial [Chloroflexi bacterium]|nr:hypothetical protein [Chloroflexota bacterium]
MCLGRRLVTVVCLALGLGGLAAVSPPASLALLPHPQVTITCTPAGNCTAQGSNFTPSGQVQVLTYAGATAFSSEHLWASAAQYDCDYSRRPPCQQVGGGDFTTTLPVDYSLACGATAAGSAYFTDIQTRRTVSQPVTWVGPCPAPTTTALTIPGTVDTGWTAATNPAQVTAGSTAVTSGTITITVNGVTFCSYSAGAQTGCSLANL